MDRCSILHLSDLHFGRHSDQIVEGVFQFVRSLPSRLRLVIVTGDLTQRARPAEFRHAAEFLQKLRAVGAAVVVIPGNHDVSLYNPYLRFVHPFRAYEEFIGREFADSYEDDDLCVLGLRTNDLRTVAEGRLTRRHAERARACFTPARGKLRLLALHHPLLESLASPYAREILGVGPEMVLSGHRHRYGVVRMQAAEKPVLSLSAGTAVSTRTREEENGFNWIEFSPAERRGTVRALLFKQDRFEVNSEDSFILPPRETRASRHGTSNAPGHGPAPGPLRTHPSGRLARELSARSGGKPHGRKEEQHEEAQREDQQRRPQVREKRA